MMTTFTWTVSQLDCYPQADNQTDVVFTVHWQLTGTDGTFSGSVYSTCGVPAPTDSFTPYADLTLDQVLGWIWINGVNKDSAEAAVQAQIDAQKNPTVIAPALPWVK
jgi:hypothetical protein